MGPGLALRPLRYTFVALVCAVWLQAPLVQAHSEAGHLPHYHFSQDLKNAVHRAEPLVEKYGYVGVGLAVGAEGLGIPLPGQTALMAASLEASRGHLNMIVLFVLALVAAVIGNSIGYLLGRVLGRKLLRKLRVSEEREEKMVGFFDRFGGGFILLARFLDGPRQLNGMLAGMLGMPWWLFTIFNVTGALLWVGIWGLGTFYLWQHVGAVHALFDRLNPWAIALALVSVLAIAIYLLRGRGTPSA